MNILIKLTCLVGLVIAPILGSGHEDKTADAACVMKEVSCEGNKACCKAKKAVDVAELPAVEKEKTSEVHAH